MGNRTPEQKARRRELEATPGWRAANNAKRRKRYAEDQAFHEQLLAKQTEVRRELFTDSEYRAVQNEKAQTAQRKRMADVEYRATYNEKAKEYQRKRRPVVKDKLNVRRRERRASDPEYRDKERTRSAQRYANPAIRERTLTQQKERYWTDNEYREKLRELMRARGKSPDFRAYQNEYNKRRYWTDDQYRAKVRERGNALKRRRRQEMIDRLLDRDGDVCSWCKELIGDDPVIDHIYPSSLDGPTVYENLQLLHWACNREKWDSVIESPR